MRTLVTGAQGFVGRYTVARLLQESDVEAVIGIGRSSRSDEAFMHSVFDGERRIAAPLTPELHAQSANARYCYYPVDVTDANRLAELIRAEEVDSIIHLASTRREESVERLIDGNVQGTCALIEAARGSVARFVLGSSGGVYGSPTEFPLTEDAAALPGDPYAASKLASEHFALILCAAAKMSLAIGRIFNVVGPGQDERHICGRFASLVAAIEAGRQEPEIQAGALQVTRDFVDVRDVASAMVLLLRTGEDGQTYNVGSGRETAIGEVLEVLLEAVGLSGRVRIRGGAAHTGAARHYADIQKLYRLGFRNEFKLGESLRDLAYYYRGLPAGGSVAA